MNLTRPLAFFDLETTGSNPYADRIVEIAVVTLEPNKDVIQWSTRVNPEMSIPVESTKVHGITDADVQQAPSFAQVAPQVQQMLFGKDLAGFGVDRFDVPMLRAEFKRVGLELTLSTGAIVVDVMRLYQKREPRDLSSAVRKFLDRDHAGAHGALADAQATLEVLLAQSLAYGLEGDAASIAAEYVDPDAVDDEGKFRRVNGAVVFTFGKHKGRKLDDVARETPDFLGWMLKADFSPSTKAIVHDALTPRAILEMAK